MKTTGQNGYYEAEWNGERFVAQLESGETWLSEDGNNWQHPDGTLPDSLEFVGAQIHFVGGPRNGESVS
ncbi:MAG: hypothetical protein KGJ13_09270 [Patescibacteria group bacterium]|nr:hypothetical protein [Patescibacteria group bacterium]